MNYEAIYCPFCGARIGEWLFDGRSVCGECGARFYVDESCDSERKADRKEDET